MHMSHDILFFLLTDRSNFLWDFSRSVNVLILLLTCFTFLLTTWLMVSSLTSTFSHSYCDPESFLWSVCRIIFFYKLFPLKWQVSSANIAVITSNVQCWRMPFWFFLLPFSTVYCNIISCCSLFFLSNALTDPEQPTWWSHHLGLQTCLFSHCTWCLGIRVNISPCQSFCISGCYLVCMIYWQFLRSWQEWASSMFSSAVTLEENVKLGQADYINRAWWVCVPAHWSFLIHVCLIHSNPRPLLPL